MHKMLCFQIKGDVTRILHIIRIRIKGKRRINCCLDMKMHVPQLAIEHSRLHACDKWYGVAECRVYPIRCLREVPDSLESFLADTIGAEGRSSVRSTKYYASHPNRIPRYPPTEPERPSTWCTGEASYLDGGWLPSLLRSDHGVARSKPRKIARACIRY